MTDKEFVTKRDPKFRYGDVVRVLPGAGVFYVGTKGVIMGFFLTVGGDLTYWISIYETYCGDYLKNESYVCVTEEHLGLLPK